MGLGGTGVGGRVLVGVFLFWGCRCFGQGHHSCRLLVGGIERGNHILSAIIVWGLPGTPC